MEEKHKNAIKKLIVQTKEYKKVKDRCQREKRDFRDETQERLKILENEQKELEKRIDKIKGKKKDIDKNFKEQQDAINEKYNPGMFFIAYRSLHI